MSNNLPAAYAGAKQKNITMMNKNSWKNLVPCLAMALCSVAFTSCSDDDEGSAPKGPVATYNGKLPTQVGSYNFYYDDNGRCYNISSSYGYDVVNIDYKKLIISTDDEEDYMHVVFNNKGYITKIYGSWNYSDGSEYERGSGTVTFKYDGDGHLTAQTGTSKESYSYDGEKSSYTGSGKVTCTWKGGDFVSARYEYTETEDGKTDTETEEYKVTYDNTLNNKTGQFPMAFTDIFGDDQYLLALVGMFGKGPAHLPELIECKTIYGDGSSYNEQTYAEYGLNADGTIDWEMLNGYRYEYSYKTYSANGDEATPAAKMTKAMQAGQKKLRVRDFFMPKRNRK